MHDLPHDLPKPKSQPRNDAFADPVRPTRRGLLWEGSVVLAVLAGGLVWLADGVQQARMAAQRSADR
jgi:hypothetical protein